MDTPLFFQGRHLNRKICSSFGKDFAFLVAAYEKGNNDFQIRVTSLGMEYSIYHKEHIIYSCDLLYHCLRIIFKINVVVVALLFYVHCKHLRSCRDVQLT